MGACYGAVAVELQHVKTFVTVAEQGSITRAAERLHLSQPAVSAQIKALEQRLCTVLFERTARGMRPTADALRLLPKAEALLVAYRELRAEAARLDGEVSGRLRLGLGANSDSTVAGRLVALLAERYPAVTVHVREGDSETVLAELLADRLDAGFLNTTGDPDDRLQTVEVSRFGLRLVAPPRASVPTPLDWASLAEMTWIYPPPSSGCGQALRALLEQHELVPQHVIDVDRESATRALVSAGTGIGVLHGYTADDAAAHGDLQILADVHHEQRVQFGFLRARAKDPVLQVLADVVRELSV